MTRSGDRWQSLGVANLPHLAPVWGRRNRGVALDPHLLWWDLTTGRTLATRSAQAKSASATLPLSVMVQAKEGQRLSALRAHGLQHDNEVRETSATGIGTGRVDRHQLSELIAAAGRVLLGPNAPPLVPGQVFDPRVSKGDGALIGIVDDGCAFLNASLRRPGDKDGVWKSRVRWLWDQGRDQRGRANGHWCPTRYAYGGELTQRGFDRACKVAHRSGEAAGYKSIGYLVDSVAALPPISHGTFMAALAGGNLDDSGLWGAEGGGAANESELAVVALPRATIDDTSGHSLAVHLLDGVNWILSKAAPRQPVVVNLSLAYYGGPHDGSDLLRMALGELVRREWEDNLRPLILVTGAGNAYESGLHAQWLDNEGGLPEGRSASWWWDVPAGDPTDSFLNIWSDGPLELTVQAPLGADPIGVAPGRGYSLWRNGRVIGLAVNLTRSAQGAGYPVRHHIHLALAPTIRCAPAGRWAITVKNCGQRACWFDAWVDRDDAPLGSVGTSRAPSRLRDREGWPTVVSSERTMNALASDCVLAAAAAMRSGDPSRYSGAGTTLAGATADRPLLAMQTDDDVALPGLQGPAPASGVLTRISGTSVSSALLAREVVAVLASGPAQRLTSLADVKDQLLHGLVPPPPVRRKKPAAAGMDAGDAQEKAKEQAMATARMGAGASHGRLRRRDLLEKRSNPVRSP